MDGRALERQASRAVGSQALLMRGSTADAEDAAHAALAALDGCDLLITRAEAHLALADALEARGRMDHAAIARAEAGSVLQEKRFAAAVAFWRRRPTGSPDNGLAFASTVEPFSFSGADSS